MSAPNVLIAGAGIAGGAFAFCLLRAFPSANITIVERAPGLLLTGASIDIRSSAVDVIKWMGLEPEIAKQTTKEEGICMLDTAGKAFAEFRSSGRTDVQSFTSEYEIFRGALAKAFIDPITDKIKLIFDDQVDTYDETPSGVTVTFKNSRDVKTYDMLVAADGIGSSIRGTILNAKPREQIYDTGLHIAYFTIKKDLLDGSRMAKWWSTTDRRAIFLRPDIHPDGYTRGNLVNYLPQNDTKLRPRIEQALQDGPESYKSLMEEVYADAGWLAPEVLTAMRNSDDFYSSFFGIVKTPKLSHGHVALIGDAGTAAPGIGTSLAIIAGYALAGEMLRSPGDLPAALQRYEELMLPFARSQQGSENDMPAFILPESKWGLALRNFCFRTVSTLRIDRLAFTVMAALGISEKKIAFPKYPWPEHSSI